LPTFRRSELTDSIVRYLREQPKETRVSYDELSHMINATVDSRSAALIYARKILERDHNQVWTCVRPGIGIVRANDMQIANRQREWWLKGARSKIIRGGREADVVDTNLLDIAVQARFATDCIQRELVEQSLSRATRARLDKVARGNGNDLPAFNAVEWAITLSPRRRRQ
jgi:hypothetical protein